MQAYLGNPELKQQVLEKLRAHFEADEIVQGIYWENGKGCAVGCILHDLNPNNHIHCDHIRFEYELGVPQIVARLMDKIFEGLEASQAKSFPIECMQAIQVGDDLSSVWPTLALWLMEWVEPITEIGLLNIYTQILNGIPLEGDILLEIKKAAVQAAINEADRYMQDAYSYRVGGAVIDCVIAAQAGAEAAADAIEIAAKPIAPDDAPSEKFYLKMKNKFIEILKGE